MLIQVPFTNNIFVDNDKLLIGEKEYNREFIDMSLYWDIEDKRVSVATVLIAANMAVKLPPKLIGKIIPCYKDGDSTNKDIRNLYYKFPDGGLQYPKNKKYYYIPYFTSNLLTKNGQFLDLTTKREIHLPLTNNGKYKRVYVNQDFAINRNGDIEISKRKTYSLHRLMCLTFKPYFDDPTKLDINHIDGVPGNDNLDNLEWCTRSENNIHANVTGLKKDNKPIIVKDYFTGEVFECFSQGDAERKTGVLKDSISSVLVGKRQHVLNGRYAFKFKTDDTPWKYKTLKEASKGLKSFIVFKNIFTGEVRELLSIETVHEYISTTNLCNFSKGLIGSILSYQERRKEFFRPYRGWFFKYKWDERPFPELTKEELIYYQKTAFSDKGIMSGAYPIVILKNEEFLDVATDSMEAEEITKIPGVDICWVSSRMENFNGYFLDRDGNRISFIRLYKDNKSLELNYCPIRQ